MYLVIRHVSTILPHCTLTWPTLNQIYCISMDMIYANMWVRRICLNTSIQYNNIQTWIRYAKCNRRICSGNNTKSKLCRIHWMINKIVGDSIDVWDYLNYAWSRLIHLSNWFFREHSFKWVEIVHPNTRNCFVERLRVCVIRFLHKEWNNLNCITCELLNA